MDRDEADLPELRALGARLRARTAVDVPPEVDRAILAHARHSLVRRPRWWLRVAAAAALLLAFGLLGRQSARRQEVAAQPSDIDRNGVVDIADAYLLALRIRRAERLESAWDLNGDGAVDAADVDAIARESVSLSRIGG